MAAEKVVARDVIALVSDGAVSPTWIEIAGKNSLTYNPGENEETADSTTFDDDGMYQQYIMQRGGTLELEGFLMEDPVTGVRDPGQARCDVLSAAVGLASRGAIRFRTPASTTWRVWACTFSPGEQGGKNNDLSSFKMKMTRCGAATSAAVV